MSKISSGVIVCCPFAARGGSPAWDAAPEAPLALAASSALGASSPPSEPAAGGRGGGEVDEPLEGDEAGVGGADAARGAALAKK